MPPAEAAGLKIPCTTAQHLQAELDALAAVLEPEEREDTWEKFEKAIIRFAGITRGGGYKQMDIFVRGVGNKGVGLRIVDCMMSDRGRLSGVSTDLLQTMAPRLAQHFAPLVHLYLPPLIRLLARPNKVFIKRAEKCLATIIQHCHLPTILIHLRSGLDDRSDLCRRASSVGIESTMMHWEHHRWAEKDLEVLELCIRKMATDRDGDVRKIARRVWALFGELWPERVDDFTDPLTPTVRRYLDIPAGEGPSKPKPRPALRPRVLASDSAPGPSSRPHTATQAHGNAAPRTRSATRNPPTEQRHHVGPSHSVQADSAPHMSRSSSHTLLSHVSSSSSLGKPESARTHILSKPSRPGLYSKDSDSSSSKRLPPPSRTVSQSSDRPDEEPRSTRSVPATRPVLRPLRSAASADSIKHVPDYAAITVPEPSSLSKATVRERVSELEKMAEEKGTPTAYRLSPSKQDLARAAAVPLPEDSPVVAKCSLPPQPPPRAALPESPSLSQLLHRNVHNDAPEMPSLLDLSMADMTAHAGSPAPVAKRQLSQTLREPAPSPGSVAQLIGRFSKSPQETPNKPTTTRPRASSSPLAQDTTPASAAEPSGATLSAHHTPSPGSVGTPASSSSGSEAKERRISPLPRRASNIASETAADNEDSPNRSLKRKGSDIELSFSESTPVARSKLAPRFSQPLIAFDSPMRRQSIRPFVFGGGHAGFFDDLMEIQAGGPVEEGDEGAPDDIAANDINQFLHGLVATPVSSQDEPARFADAEEDDGNPIDLLGSPAPPTLPQALEPESEPEPEPEDDTIVATNGEVNLLGLDPEPEAKEPLAAQGTEVEEANDDAEVSESQSRPTPVTTDSMETARQPEPEAPEQPADPVAVAETKTTPDVDELERTLAATTIASPTSADDSRRPHEQTPQVSESTRTQPIASPVDQGLAAASTPATPPGGDEISADAAAPTAHADREEPEAATPTQLELAAPEAEQAVPPQPELVARPQQRQQQVSVAESHQDTQSSPNADAQSAVRTQRDEPEPSASARLPTAPPAGRRHMRNVTAPAQATTSRLGPPSRPVRPAAGAEKKSFKPTSRLGVSDSSKSAPAPARLAMATKASQAKAAAAAPTQRPAQAGRAVSASAAASKPPSRGPSRPASRQVSRTASPLPDHEDSAASSGVAPSKPTTHAPRSVSNLLKPTAAAAARAAANATALAASKEKEKDTKDARKVTQPVAPASRSAAPRIVSNSRPAGGLSAPTAASRARAEAALPPVKRQRVKLKAPMESFRPGRGRANPSKAAIVGQAGPARGRRQATAKKDTVETFPLPGPLLGSAPEAEKAETPAQEPERESMGEADPPPAVQPASAPERASSLAIPRSQQDYESESVDVVRTPTALSPLAHSAALSPASSRQTERSFDSSRSGSSPRKMRPAPSRPLEPVLTPMNSTHSAPYTPASGSHTATPSRSDGDTPATAHARRISGIPASVKRAMSSASPRSPVPAVSEETDGDLFGSSTPSREKPREGDGVTNVVRHDVSTPPAKSAASLLAKLSSLQLDERKVLTPRDANRDKRDE